MNVTKINIQMDGFQFSAEGKEQWVDSKFKDAVNLARKMNTSKNFSQSTKDEAKPKATRKKKAKLAKKATKKTRKSQDAALGPEVLAANQEGILRKMEEIDAGKNQNKRFIAVSLWLMETLGTAELSTRQVVRALRAYPELKLTNPSNSLNQLIVQDMCVKNPETKLYSLTPKALEKFG